MSKASERAAAFKAIKELTFYAAVDMPPCNKPFFEVTADGHLSISMRVGAYDYWTIPLHSADAERLGHWLIDVFR